ncbi:PH domain-containing protein [bacterium]|nr:PH domain-containing protein [bacterium]
MITLQPGEHIILAARRHPFFLFLEMIPLLPLILLPLLLIILGQFVDIGSYLDRQTNRVAVETGIITPLPDNLQEDSEEFPASSRGAGNNHRALPVLLVGVWLLLVWIAIFVIWTDYYLDVLILTNKKIIDIEQRGLFVREVTSLPLEKIQDATVSTEGIIATLFHFGNLEIQTAGESRKMIIQFIADPNTLKGEIMRAYEKVAQTPREVRVVN